MNKHSSAYKKLEDYHKDLLHYVDLKLAAYYEAIQPKEVEETLGWSLRSTSPAIDGLEKRAASFLALMEEKVHHTLPTAVFIPLAHLVETYALSDFEKFCLFLAFSAELDPSFEKSFRSFNEAMGSPHPTLGLALKIHCQSLDEYILQRSDVKRDGKLFRYFFSRAFEDQSKQPLTGVSLRLDPEVLHYLLHFDQAPRRQGFYQILAPMDRPVSSPHREIFDKLCAFMEENHAGGLNRHVAFFMEGPDGIGKTHLALSFLHQYDQQTLLVNCKHLKGESAEIYTLTKEALMHRATVVLQNFHELSARASDSKMRLFLGHLFEELRRFAKVLFILTEEPWLDRRPAEDFSFVDIQMSPPGPFIRQKLWQEGLENQSTSSDVDTWELANKFLFTPQKIQDALTDATNAARWQGKEELDSQGLHAACYRQLSHGLKERAQVIHSAYTWEDLVLPAEQKKRLQEACDQMRYRHIVYDQWGFSEKLTYGKGLGLLFTGPPGTGKTLAAQVVAGALRLEIYRVDLSQIISKYVGETEKNLRAIFDEAEKSQAILLFDEGDALFSKRTEVQDANDKYANVETSFLLQKIENYSGISVVTTNLLGQIDEAFIRRFSFVVHFPFPTAQDRREIWKKIFPEKMPLAGDVDFHFLGDRFELAGGSIKNIAVNAAFLAASENRPLSMVHLIPSVAAEIAKTGKSVLPSEFGHYAHLL